MIPALCDYVIFSENGEKIGGDLSEQYEQIAWNVAKYGNASGKYFYKVIVRENEYVYIDAKEQDGRLTFIVEDSGSGFTKEALLHGTEQFFMDDTSRNGEAHYGMGLFFAKTVAEKYGGGIKLSNSENTGGARVEIFFLSSQETS